VAFHLDGDTRWQGGGATAGSGDLDRQADPLAAPGLALDAEPLRFYRGGAGGTALGQWAVMDGQGQVAGVYTALFARHRGSGSCASWRRSRPVRRSRPSRSSAASRAT